MTIGLMAEFTLAETGIIRVNRMHSERQSEDSATHEFVPGVQVESTDHYQPARYLSPSRMASIGYQVSFHSKFFGVGRVLEIGVGSGLTKHLLTLQGNSVSTFDIDERLKPDMVGSVTDIPAKDASFDTFVCCQVLEHIPWEAAQKAMRELCRVSRHGGIISVPTNRARCFIKLFNRSHTGWRRIPIPLRNYKRIRQPDQHHWELEASAGGGVNTKRFCAALAESGFKLLKDLQPAEFPYHHFFVVEKAGANR